MNLIRNKLTGRYVSFGGNESISPELAVLVDKRRKSDRQLIDLYSSRGYAVLSRREVRLIEQSMPANRKA